MHLAESTFQHLDSHCHLILAHHNTLRNADILSSLIPHNKERYIYQLPDINIKTWTSYPGPAIHRKNNSRAVFGISQAAKLFKDFCFIGVIITTISDFPTNLEKLSDYQFARLTTHQTNILNHILYTSYPTGDANGKSNLDISLLIRIQVNFNRIMHEGRIGSAAFKLVYNLILVDGKGEWHYITPTTQWGCKSKLLSPKDVVQTISNYSHFDSALEPPSDLFMLKNRRSSLNLDGYYTGKECCDEYGKNPFHLITEKLYHPRSILFISLVCLGNFTYGKATDLGPSEDNYREHRGKEEYTYREYIFMNVYREEMQYAPNLYVVTINQGFSFMTCFSREELSFKIFLKPFEPEVWIVLLLTIVVVGTVYVVILVSRLNWDWLQAVSFAQLAVISIVLERPVDVDRKIARISAFKFMIGFWALLYPILSNGYLGLIITSISSPLESRSVTQFYQLTKPGCDWGKTECLTRRINGFNKYFEALRQHLFTSWRRFVITDTYQADFLKKIFDPNPHAERLRNQSIRRFDPTQDFVLIPYSFEENLFNKVFHGRSSFDTRVQSKVKTIMDTSLPKLKLGHQISSESMDILRLLDLIDPWRVPHPFLGNLTETRYIENEWDLELALVQCGRTALVLDNREIEIFVTLRSTTHGLSSSNRSHQSWRQNQGRC
ncbi:hypothetical protein Fcan01_25302 [Folsomia candida]|uniref:Uncharacterized protein n=1 Tax=Folsomia candida TaxID=158441 RepID=A0A226D6R9_FOLCA|nr:hypothetical protein Fcan01_25302 [Folsomia candida]